MEKHRRLCGAKFQLLDCEGCPICCGTTDEHGLLCFDDLPIGKFFIKEIEAPCGYRPCKEVIKVDLSCHEPCKTVEVHNERIRGKITIVKVGDDRW